MTCHVFHVLAVKCFSESFKTATFNYSFHMLRFFVFKFKKIKTPILFVCPRRA